jgi:hypothetical protein
MEPKPTMQTAAMVMALWVESQRPMIWKVVGGREEDGFHPLSPPLA